MVAGTAASETLYCVRAQSHGGIVGVFSSRPFLPLCLLNFSLLQGPS